MYRMLLAIRKIYDVQVNCDNCGKPKGNRYILFTIDNGSVLRCNGYFCFECIPGISRSYQDQNYNTIPYHFISKLLKLNKVIRLNSGVDQAIRYAETNDKKITTKKAR